MMSDESDLDESAPGDQEALSDKDDEELGSFGRLLGDDEDHQLQSPRELHSGEGEELEDAGLDGVGDAAATGLDASGLQELLQLRAAKALEDAKQRGVARENQRMADEYVHSLLYRLVEKLGWFEEERQERERMRLRTQVVWTSSTHSDRPSRRRDRKREFRQRPWVEVPGGGQFLMMLLGKNKGSQAAPAPDGEQPAGDGSKDTQAAAATPAPGRRRRSRGGRNGDDVATAAPAAPAAWGDPAIVQAGRPETPQSGAGSGSPSLTAKPSPPLAASGKASRHNKGAAAVATAAVPVGEVGSPARGPVKDISAANSSPSTNGARSPPVARAPGAVRPQPPPPGSPAARQPTSPKLRAGGAAAGGKGTASPKTSAGIATAVLGTPSPKTRSSAGQRPSPVEVEVCDILSDSLDADSPEGGAARASPNSSKILGKARTTGSQGDKSFEPAPLIPLLPGFSSIWSSTPSAEKTSLGESLWPPSAVPSDLPPGLANPWSGGPLVPSAAAADAKPSAAALAAPPSKSTPPPAHKPHGGAGGASPLKAGAQQEPPPLAPAPAQRSRNHQRAKRRAAEKQRAAEERDGWNAPERGASDNLDLPEFFRESAPPFVEHLLGGVDDELGGREDPGGLRFILEREPALMITTKWQ